jgi:hypothetical protein
VVLGRVEEKVNPVYRVLALQCLLIADAVCEDQVMATVVAAMLLSCITAQALAP